jgi:hypothetical protein
MEEEESDMLGTSVRVTVRSAECVEALEAIEAPASVRDADTPAGKTKPYSRRGHDGIPAG